MTEKITYGVPAVEVPVNSSVGAGDALVAGLVYSMEEGKSFEDAIRVAVATSAGAVMTAGTKPPTSEMVQKLEERVHLFEISTGM